MDDYHAFLEDLGKLVSAYWGKGKFRDSRTGIAYKSGRLCKSDPSKAEFDSDRGHARFSFGDLIYFEKIDHD